PTSWGALRRIEARIGALLGPDKGVGGRGVKRPHADGFERQRRGEYRALADLVRRGVLRYEDDEEERDLAGVVLGRESPTMAPIIRPTALVAASAPPIRHSAFPA
ncbi:MAG: hypothetical protein M3470_05890, partial [Chloroflexota bacterium]|nr:hypothetical protein [Chloroflexota bacterium]